MQRMLQNMPSADFIGKALGIEQSGVESLLQQGKGYLAQQLTQRGVLPGATLAVLPQPGKTYIHIREYTSGNCYQYYFNIIENSNKQ